MSSSSTAQNAHVFTPAIAVLNRLPYLGKFALIGTIIAVPLGGLFYYVSNDVNNRMGIIDNELGGSKVLSHTVQTVNDLILREHLVIEKGMAITNEEKLIADRTDIMRQDIQKMSKLIAATPHMKANAWWREVQAGLEGVLDSKASERRSIITEHAPVFDKLLAAISGDMVVKSDLILDDDLASISIIMSVSVDLPVALRRFQQSYLYTMFMVNDRIMSDDFRNRRIEAISLMNQALGRLLQTYQTMHEALVAKVAADDANKDAYQQIDADYGKALTILTESLRGYITLTNDAILDVEINDAAKAKEICVKLATEFERISRDEMSPYIAAAERSLQGLVAIRDVEAKQKKFNAVVLGVGGIALLSYLFLGFYLAIRGQVAFIGANIRRMIDGTAINPDGSAERIQPQSRDEIAQIVEQNNLINVALVQSRELQRKVENENEDIQRTIETFAEVLMKVSDGDLTARAAVTEGTMGMMADALNMTIESLSTLISQANSVAEQANQAAAAIAELADAQADGAADTDARVADASRAVTDIVAGLRLVSDNADMAAATARKAQEQAEQGAQAVAKVVDGMDDLRVGVGATAKKIKALGDRSMEIAGMVGSIAKISERTSLLALNAAIEAARAGEHGRGFAVVADNVKDLSEKTQNTTQDIDKLARSIQVETNDSVGAMEEQTATVEDEAKVVAVAGQALDGIRQSATHSAEVVADITQIVKTQAQGAETVLGIMTNLSGLASNNRLDAEKTRQSAQELEHLAGELTSNLSRFKVV